MQKVIAEAIVEAMEEQGYEASVREGYSGRGMFGKETTGIVTDSVGTVIQAILSDLLEESSIIRQVAEENDISPFDIDHISIDSMGLNTIIY